MATMTRDLAISLPTGRTLYHATVRNADGSAARARINGRCKTWKRDPERFELPMKHGLRDCFYITPRNMGEWLTEDPTEEARETERREKRLAQVKRKLNLAADTPAGIVHDAMLDAGMGEVLAEIVCR